MLNTVPAKAQARQPRAAVKINGIVAPFISWEADTNSFYQADTFRCSLPISSLPDGLKLSDLGTASKLEVEIFAGFPADPARFTADDLESIFFGRADDVGVAMTGRTIELSGRDLTGAFIDAKSSEKYVNQTASEVAQTLAGKHGLTAVVAPTKRKVGRLYQIDQVRLQDEKTDWDLLTWLAREEDMVCYVKGKELHFEQKPDPTKNSYVLQWTETDGSPSIFNGTTLGLSRSLTLAKGIEVTVKTWNAKQKKAFTRVAKRTKSGSTDLQKYSYTIPGLSADQAQQRADKLLEELSRHELKISFAGPADNLLGKSDVIQLTGTGSAWDQVYYPSSINRSFDQGYAWRVDAKNHAAGSEPTEGGAE